LVGIFASSLTGSGITKSPTWAQVVLTVLLVVAVVQFLVAYNYLLFTDPQALDSEAHKQEMRRLELGYTGDDRGGFRRSAGESTVPQSKTIGTPPMPRRK
jgi:hypothetical protein